MNNSEKIQYIAHQKIDSEKWNACIENAPNRRIYAMSWHLDRATEVWDALVYGDYEFVMPLPKKRKWGIVYVYQPSYCQQLGIFPTPSKKITELFYSELIRLFKYFEIQVNSGNLSVQTFQGISFSPRNNYILPLNMNYAGLFSGYSANTVRNLKKAGQHKLSFMSGVSLEEYMDFKLENSWKKLSKEEWIGLKRLISFGVYKGIGKIYGVYSPQNKLCTAGYFCRFENRVTYMNGVSDEKGKKWGAMKLLIDGFIQQNAGNNIILDFEGSMVPGIARFFKGFGAYPETYFHLKFNGLPVPFKWLKQ